MEQAVTIIITPRDRYSGLDNCVDAVYRHTPRPFRLWIMDLGYPAAIIDPLRRQLRDRPEVRFFELGLRTPMDALREAQPLIDTPAVVLLDNDSRVTEGWLPPLLAAMADGRPVYRSVDRSDPDCLTSPGDAAVCSGRGFNNDFLLTTGAGGSQTVASFILSQSYDWGLDWTLGYAWTQSEELSPMTSSVAFSNYANAAVLDPNNPDVATSNYEIPHRITMAVNYERAFFGDYATRFTLFGRANEGRPYSYTFTGDDGSVFGDSVNRRHLLYVPAGPADPNVVFAPGFDQASFFSFLQESGLDEYAGGAAPRNAFQSDWWTKFDLRVEQELPGFSPGHRTSAFLVVENLGNLINDEWGVLREAAFPQAQDVVNVGRNAAGQYVFEEFFLPAGQSRVADASLWEIRVGLRYQF